MATEKKVFPEFKIKPYEDMAQRWYVSFKFEGRWKKRYGNINSYDTYEERMRAARRLIRKLKAELPRQHGKEERLARKFIKQNQYRWRKKTLQQYHTVCNSFFKFMEDRPVNADGVGEYLQRLMETRHPNTYNRYLIMLRLLLKESGMEYLLEPYKSIKADKTPARYLQPYQAKRLMEAIEAKDEDLALFVKFIYYCFIRPGELRRLRAGDILLEDEEIRVPNTISKNRKLQYVVIPKPFVPQLQYLYGYAPNAYLFPSPQDASKPIGERTMYRRHQLVLDELNFGPGYTLYSWKHTGAVALAKTGKVSMKELQLQLRHHSLDETDKYLRQMGVKDLGRLKSNFPTIWE